MKQRTRRSRAPGTSILGGLDPARFLKAHWQKKPLLIRQAIPGFQGFVDVPDLVYAAGLPDVAARVVIDHEHAQKKADAGARWELIDSDLEGLDVARMPKTHWTLLVQGVESLLPGGWELLRKLDFLPAARVDDLMISYAAPSGSVGPHLDAYDVFLLQGPGRRRWQISTRPSRAFDEGEPIKILKDFVPDDEWVLEPGDMLYLPPGVAHWGTALEQCFTYSLGLLAPSHESLVQNFLVYLGQVLEQRMPEGIYRDAGLALAKDPLAIGDDMVARTKKILGAIRYDDVDVGDFVGRLLTGPKPSVHFPLAKPMSIDGFVGKLRNSTRGSLALTLPSRGLVRDRRVFLNGDAIAVGAKTFRIFRELIAERAVPLPVLLPDDVVPRVYDWYADGWVTFA